MSSAGTAEIFYIGWDVGGWNCDKNAKSRDAVVILNPSLGIVGTPWRGNLRQTINETDSTESWIQALFSLCGADQVGNASQVYLAIDTPLGFSEAFMRLVTELQGVTSLGKSAENPYLFRQTERHLFEHGLTPLSAVKDMIGSQATKGMHVLARYAPETISCGVWSGGKALTAFEAYPSACRGSAAIHTLRSRFDSLGHEDKDDALICALVAYFFAEQREVLDSPGDDVPMKEGWIWVPRDALN